jgi:hypothetical protein
MRYSLFEQIYYVHLLVRAIKLLQRFLASNSLAIPPLIAMKE